jgi:hypothetical protein
MAGGAPAGRRERGTVSPAAADRILVGSCAAIWLMVVGMSAAAGAALADLGRGFHNTPQSPHTSSVLYAVIVISALIILAAIPMLLRARRTTSTEPAIRSGDVPMRDLSVRASRPGDPSEPAVTQHARTERLTALRPVTALPEAAMDRIWLRGVAALVGVMGMAFVGVAAATYLMAIGRDGAAWTCYVFAGLLTAAMPAIPWRLLRHVRYMLAEYGPPPR